MTQSPLPLLVDSDDCEGLREEGAKEEGAREEVGSGGGVGGVNTIKCPCTRT